MKDTWKANLLLSKGSKTIDTVSLEVEGQDVMCNNDIAHSMNKFFCSVGHKLSDNISHQANPLLSNEYILNRLRTQYRFETVTPLNVESALKKMKTLFRFTSDDIASYFLKIALPVIASSLCKILNNLIETLVFPDAFKAY